MSSATTTIPVILDHDGGVDDFVALIILASAHAFPETYSSSSTPVPKIKLLGVTIVEADTFAEPCVDVCRRALALYGTAASNQQHKDLASIPVAASNLNGTAAPFPDQWRQDSYTLSDFPVLNSTFVNHFLKETFPSYPSNVSPHACYSKEEERKEEFKIERNGHEVLAKLVLESKQPEEPVTLVVTGPMTNVAYCVNKYGKDFTKNIGRIILMGGAAKVQGNVFNKNLPQDYKTQVSGKAEWNIFWDAPAAKTVFECPELCGKIVMFGLDATNSVPVTSQFVRRFGRECQIPVSIHNTNTSIIVPSLLSQFIGSAWSQTTFMNKGWGGSSYFAWDALTAAFLIDPSVVVESVKTKVAIE